jgi:hypothetical protein
MRRSSSTAIAPTSVTQVGDGQIDEETTIVWPAHDDANVELDARTTGSAQVRLLWHSCSGRTWVEVTPLDTGEQFYVDAAPPLARTVCSQTLRPSPLTPAVARRLARQLCQERRVGRTVADDVEMATGELVSLSVQQARSPMTLTFVIDRGDVAIEVRDGGRRLPTEVTGARTARQVDAITRLADSWGFDRLGAGRRLWALVRVRQAVSP